MKILLVSATKQELAFLVKVLAKWHLKGFAKKSAEGALTRYRIGKTTVDVLITGVGITATAFQMGKVVSNKYDWAVNIGICGSFKKSIPPGAVVCVLFDQFGDLGAEDGERFLTLKEMKLSSWDVFQAPLQGIHIGRNMLGLKPVRAITVNTVHGNTRSIKRAVKKFKPDIESMEGAAFFYACYYTKIPCIQIRAISNFVERRNKRKWKIKLALRNLDSVFEKFLDSI